MRRQSEKPIGTIYDTWSAKATKERTALNAVVDPILTRPRRARTMLVARTERTGNSDYLLTFER
jgi:hypothetical protein